MNLEKPFYKLPLALDVTGARKEISRLVTPEHWIDHASGFEGNFYIPITSYQGTINNLKRTPIEETHFAERLPEVRKLLKSFDLTIGISRLMRLAPGCSVPVHSDTNEYWDYRVRIHIPIMTSNSVFFSCGDQEVVMKAGEVWTFNNWIRHGVRNEGTEDRIHLVFDTRSTNVFDRKGSVRPDLGTVEQKDKLRLEHEPSSAIKGITELKASFKVLLDELGRINDSGEQDVEPWLDLINQHLKNWRGIEQAYGVGLSAIPKYQAAIKVAFQQAETLDSSLKLEANQVKVEALFKSRVVRGINLQMLFKGGK